MKRKGERDVRMRPIPDYLYHYTSLETLALILKNRTIRFNSLKNMDDAEEVITANSPYLGKYCFVSSWTTDEESIPIWNLYTESMKGVRIKLKSYPFKKRKARLSFYGNGMEFETYFPEELLKHDKLYPYPTVPFLREVEYTDDDTKIFPNIITELSRNANNTFNATANFNDINRYKRKKWDFLEEWRYSMVLLPHNERGGLTLDLTESGNDMPFWHYDLKMDEDALKEIEIMTGPKMGLGDKILLRCLVEKYCPTATIVESKLKIK